jgi:hypothetical protein
MKLTKKELDNILQVLFEQVRRKQASSAEALLDFYKEAIKAQLQKYVEND